MLTLVTFRLNRTVVVSGMNYSGKMQWQRLPDVILGFVALEKLSRGHKIMRKHSKESLRPNFTGPR